MANTRGSRLPRPAVGRQTSTQKRVWRNVNLTPTAQTRRFQPRQQISVADAQTQHVYSKSALTTILHQNDVGVSSTHDAQAKKWEMQLITQEADKELAIHVVDQKDDRVTAVYPSEGDLKIEVRLYTETYCIDVVEIQSGKLLRRWAFFLNTNNKLQAERAKNLWNHLCSTFSYMPKTVIESIPENPRYRDPPYQLRSSTLRQRRHLRAEAIDSGWTVELGGGQRPWKFGGFFSLMQKKLEILELGSSDTLESLEEDETRAERAWAGDKPAKQSVRKYKGKKVKRSSRR